MSKNKELYQIAFDDFKEEFLKNGKSIFRLNDNKSILYSESIQYLVDNFIDNGYAGDASFIDKINQQLCIAPKTKQETDEEKIIQNDAIEVLATAVWLWRLVPSNAKIDSTIKSVEEVLKLADRKIENDYKEKYFDSKRKGIALTGTFYNTNKPLELAYLIRFFHEYIHKKQSSEIEILKSITFQKGGQKKSGHMEIKTGTDEKGIPLSLFKQETEENEKKIIELKKKINKDFKDKKAYIKIVSIYNALLFFFDSDKYEAIISNEHKDRIAKVFSEYCKEEDDIDTKLHEIKIALMEKYNLENKNIYFFYLSGIKQMWQGSLNFQAKNMILHGAPGTGKTYITDSTIKDILKFSNSSSNQYELVQFHPSFGYEEFIDGIKPVILKNNLNGIQLKLVNGIFKSMCIDAFKELLRFNKLSETEKKTDEIKKFYFVADEINRAELSRVFGELLLCIEEDKRLSIEKKDGNLVLTVNSTIIKTQNASLWEKEHAVIIMDGANILDSIDKNGNYILDDGKDYDYYFGVPENLYFIGTMNDIDRSVDSFDMALRRRFIWKHFPYDEEIVEENYLEKSDTDEKLKKLTSYLKNCKNLNDYIVSEDGFNLPESYMLGHSYFMNLLSFSDTQLQKRWEERISPLLTEYLRVNFEGKALIKQLKEAKEKFIPKKKS